MIVHRRERRAIKIRKRRSRKGNPAGALNELGGRYGLLTVIGQAGRYHGEIRWLCRCDCGRLTAVPGSRLRSGETRSCGCLQRARTVLLNRERARYRPDDFVVQLALRRDLTAAEVAAELNRLGVPRPDERPWDRFHQIFGLEARTIAAGLVSGGKPASI